MKNRIDVDEKNVSVSRKTTLKMLMPYVLRYKNEILFTILLVFISSVAELLPPYFTKIVVDTVFPQKNYVLLAGIIAVLVLAHLLFLILTRKKAKIIHTVGQKIIHDIRYDLFCHLQTLPFSYFDSRPLGKITVRVVNYINSISNLLSDGIVDIITGIFTLVIIVVFMLLMDVKFTIICLLTLPVFLLIRFGIKKKHREVWNKYSAKQSNLNAYIQENISGMKVIQSFSREEVNAEKFSELCDENRKYWMKAKFIELAIPFSVNVLYVLTVVIIYLYGAGRINSGLEVGVLIAFSSYLNKFWAPITMLSTYYNMIVNNFVYIDRIFETMSEKPVITDSKNAEILPPVKGDVEFKNVTFKYEDNAPNILENLSFHIKPGMKVALVGPTGAGKSTIINLLSRFYDISGGEILIDGHNIKNVTLKSLRTQMGIMMQDSFLFSGTVKDNIRYGKLDATDEEVINAAKLVSADEFINSFPDGFDTVITERGGDISAGQKQLIAFARTIIKNPAILILDEATSSVDTETELMLQKGTEGMMQGRTSFVVAHRLSTIINSDLIMFIGNKGILEAGTHAELMGKKGRYYELYTSQLNS